MEKVHTEIDSRIPEPAPDVDKPVSSLEETVDAYYGPESERSVDGQLHGDVALFHETRDRFETLIDHRLEDAHREHRDRCADFVTLEDEEWTRYQDYVDDTLEEYADRSDVDELPRREVTPTDQSLPEIRLELDTEATVTTVWEQLFEYDRIRMVFAETVQSVLEGLDPAEVYDRLEETSVLYWLRSWIVDAARGSNRGAWTVAADILPTMHTYPLCITEDLLATASLFAGAEQPLQSGRSSTRSGLRNASARSVSTSATS